MAEKCHKLLLQSGGWKSSNQALFLLGTSGVNPSPCLFYLLEASSYNPWLVSLISIFKSSSLASSNLGLFLSLPLPLLCPPSTQWKKYPWMRMKKKEKLLLLSVPGWLGSLVIPLTLLSVVLTTELPSTLSILSFRDLSVYSQDKTSLWYLI